MTICYYITSHGLGHCVRSAALINRIPVSVNVIVRTEVPVSFLRQEIRRPFTLQPASFDRGTLHGEGITVDPLGTLKACHQINVENSERFDSECQFLKRQGVSFILSDSASFPFAVARTCGIPGYFVGNFTWACIFSQYLDLHPEYSDAVRHIEQEYAQATKAFRLAFATPMDCIKTQLPVGLLCREAENKRAEIAKQLNADPSKRWVLFYLGQWPTEFDWSRLTKLQKTHCFVLGKASQPHSLVTSIDPSLFRGQDVIESCDVVVAKPGYGIAADCVGTNTPLVYTPREDFAEFPPLHADLQRWGKGVCVDHDTFYGGDLNAEIEKAATLHGEPPFRIDASKQIVDDLFA